MSSARRSERLRRKRQVSTPGLTQPGAYNLHPDGYTVESEASYIPESTHQPRSSHPFNRLPTSAIAVGSDHLARNSRRTRYRHSPHRFTVDESSPVHADVDDAGNTPVNEPINRDSQFETGKTTLPVEPDLPALASSVTAEPAPLTSSLPPMNDKVLYTPPARSTETPPPRRRRAEDTERVVNRVRASLYDILGSATRRPVNPNWRPTSFNPSTITRTNPTAPSIPSVPTVPSVPLTQQPDVVLTDDDDDEDGVVEPSVLDSHHPSWLSCLSASVLRMLRHISPLTVLLCVFLLMVITMLALEAAVASRNARDPVSAVAWKRTVETCQAITPTRLQTALKSFEYPSIPLAQNLTDFAKSARHILFRSAWPVRTSNILAAEDVITRSQLEDEILPRVLQAARDAATKEAERTTREARELQEAQAAAAATVEAATAQPVPTGDPFIEFIERFAADKDLPADFALSSAGGAVIATEPSGLTLWSRFMRRYAVALVSERRFTPTFPRPASVVLDPNVLPGNCWAFEGSRGSLTIRLARPVVVTSVTVEHTPKSSVFSISSALREFQVIGLPLSEESAEIPLGQFVFDIAGEDKRHLQTFDVAGPMRESDNPVVFRAVRLKILSNHGANYTAVYRIRVHGVEDSSITIDETDM